MQIPRRQLIWQARSEQKASYSKSRERDDGLILVIVTGGTITMVPKNDDSAMPSKNLRCSRLAHFIQSIPEFFDQTMPKFEIHEWCDLLDSSDIGLQEWIRIAREIEQGYNKYTGFVILHGTDTLAYTASALAFMLQNLSKPVVLTGSMLPMRNIQSDARKNFVVSLMVAAFSQIREVVLLFGTKILRGCRSTKMDCSDIDAFASPNAPSLGNIGVEITINVENLSVPSSAIPLYVETRILINRVVMLWMTPAFSPSLISHLIETKGEEPLGIILQMFGSGTASLGGYDLEKTLKRCQEQGIVVVAISQCPKGTCSLQTYENGMKLYNSGVIEGKDITPEAALCKLAYLLGLNLSAAELKRAFQEDLCGELTTHPCTVTGQMTLHPIGWRSDPACLTIHAGSAPITHLNHSDHW